MTRKDRGRTDWEAKRWAMAYIGAAMGDEIVLQFEHDAVRCALERVCALVQDEGGRALLVGGSVRDALLGIPAVDLDIEVYGIEPEALIALLSPEFPLDLVGKAFGVIKLKRLPIDVSLPRRETKSGRGHRGFTIDSDPQMDPEEAASRRDFTINAIAYDPLGGELIDPYGGVRDLEQGILRHTSAKFAEDPLRVLRAMQFLARFDLEIAPETLSLCASIEPEDLARERIFEEWRKLLVQGKRPSRGLAFLRDCGWLRCYPELEAAVGCAQNSKWHPEGDVWVHTLHCLDYFAAHRIGEAREDLVVGLAVLCHDLGKPGTTARIGAEICARGHAETGEKITRELLARLTEQKQLVEEVAVLVGAHLRPRQLFEAKSGAAAVRRLAQKVGRIDRLVRVACADQMGRPPVARDDFPPGDWLLARARELDVERAAPVRLIQGRHLQQLGLVPGPAFRSILDACYDAQLEGDFASVEDGIEVVRRLLQERGQEA